MALVGADEGTGMLQERMIDRVRQLCEADDRVVAAWMYGSFAWGEADVYSDIEFLIYLDDDAHASFEPLPWLTQIEPVAFTFVNEFGVRAAVFENMIRGEFHFEPASDMPKMREYKAMAGFPAPESMLIYDQTGELMEHLRYISGPGPEWATKKNAAQLWHSFLNQMLFGANVLARGERARALELLWFVQRYLLGMVRLLEGSTTHWMPPCREAERDLSPASYDRYVACTASLRGGELRIAYANAWAWGKVLGRDLATGFGFDAHDALVARLDDRFVKVFRDTAQR
ncbi:MAG: nucleotidyltransferase domain-containing protein [Anaerolineae bacterium]